jgi:phytoene dehydrogenase-like protein
LLDQPVLIAGKEQADFNLSHYCFDPTLAPTGKSSLTVLIPSSYQYWQRIYGRKLYDTEQLQVASQVLELIEKVYPGISQDVEVTDVATPISFERYTGNWMGATTGWLLTKKTMALMLKGMPKTLPALRNFFMAGQWVEPGGSIPVAAMSGRNAVWSICSHDRKEFNRNR